MLNFCDAEIGTVPFVTVTGEPTVVDVPEHDHPEKYWYVTCPPALLVWYRRVALSYTEPPTAITDFERVAVIVTVPVVTVTVFVTVTVVVEDAGAAAMVGLS
jgi:hypothetical protein